MFLDLNLTTGYRGRMTRGELIRLLKQHGWQHERTGKGSHLLLSHPTRKTVIWVSRHTRREVGRGLAHQILKDAGIEP